MLRRKLEDTPRPYATLGYPLVPLVFVGVAAWLVINTFKGQRRQREPMYE